MKLTIDTQNKTVSFDQNVNISKAVKELKKLVGNDLKNYEIIPRYLGNYPIVTYPALPYYEINYDYPYTLTHN